MQVFSVRKLTYVMEAFWKVYRLAVGHMFRQQLEEAASLLTSPERLRELSKSRIGLVSATARSNASCPSDILAGMLTKPKDMWDVVIAAQNPSCPLDVISSECATNDWLFRHIVYADFPQSVKLAAWSGRQ